MQAVLPAYICKFMGWYDMEIYVNVVNYCKAKEHIDGIFHKMFYTAFLEFLKKEPQKHQ